MQNMRRSVGAHIPLVQPSDRPHCSAGRRPESSSAGRRRLSSSLPQRRQRSGSGSWRTGGGSARFSLLATTIITTTGRRPRGGWGYVCLWCALQEWEAQLRERSAAVQQQEATAKEQETLRRGSLGVFFVCPYVQIWELGRPGPPDCCKRRRPGRRRLRRGSGRCRRLWTACTRR
jgi:hypothetical protein